MAQRIRSRRGRPAATDPVAEIDGDLRRLTADLKACRIRRETAMVERISRWIDELLDDRIYLTSIEPGPGQHRLAADVDDVPAPTRSEKDRTRAQAE